MTAQAEQCKAAAEFFDQAARSFGDALQAGIRVQDEWSKWWSDAVDQAGPVCNWQKRSSSLLNGVLPTAQKNAEEWIKAVDRNYRKSMDLLKKAFDDAEKSVAAPEYQQRAKELWEESLSVVRDSAETIAQANAKMAEAWGDVVRKSVNGVEK